MIKNIEDKAIKKDSEKVEEKSYFFPREGKTIKATSLEEAIKKLNTKKE